jgi:hypothetical protein
VIQGELLNPVGRPIVDDRPQGGILRLSSVRRRSCISSAQPPCIAPTIRSTGQTVSSCLRRVDPRVRRGNDRCWDGLIGESMASPVTSSCARHRVPWVRQSPPPDPDPAKRVVPARARGPAQGRSVRRRPIGPPPGRSRFFRSRAPLGAAEKRAAADEANGTVVDMLAGLPRPHPYRSMAHRPCAWTRGDLSTAELQSAMEGPCPRQILPATRRRCW